MLANTDLTKIKKVALNFLMLEPEPTDMPPIIKHPFTNYSCVHLDMADAHYELIDIMKDRNALERWRKHYADMIDNAKSARHIYMMLTKSYRFAFLKYAMPYFSQKIFRNTLQTLGFCVNHRTATLILQSNS